MMRRGESLSRGESDAAFSPSLTSAPPSPPAPAPANVVVVGVPQLPNAKPSWQQLLVSLSVQEMPQTLLTQRWTNQIHKSLSTTPHNKHFTLSDERSVEQLNCNICYQILDRKKIAEKILNNWRPAWMAGAGVLSWPRLGFSL